MRFCPLAAALLSLLIRDDYKGTKIRGIAFASPLIMVRSLIGALRCCSGLIQWVVLWLLLPRVRAAALRCRAVLHIALSARNDGCSACQSACRRLGSFGSLPLVLPLKQDPALGDSPLMRGLVTSVVYNYGTCFSLCIHMATRCTPSRFRG